MAESKRLISRVETKIRFSEVDSMRVVWHGNYVKYLEDGREAFGEEYQLGYYDVFEHGFMTPIVKLDVNYKKTIKYGEVIIIETEYIPTKAAKIIFKYRILNAATNKIVLAAESTQVFLDKQDELQITNPEFYIEWQKKWGLI
ncbi:MAG: acyl-CoA thioesterase [Bacteroidota bacterium]